MQTLDVFGQQISILLKGKNYHQTTFGSLLTIGLTVIIALRFFMLIKDVVLGNNPVVLFQERKNDFYTRFDINPHTFNLGLTFQDINYKYLSVENIFDIKAYLETKISIVNKDTKEVSQKWDRIPIQLEKCTNDHLQIKETYQMFSANDITNYYCLPKDLPLYIEGEFNSDNFAELIIQINKCKGPHCYDDSYMKEKIKTIYISAYFSDVYFTPENKNNPFTFYGRDIFWQYSQQFKKDVYLQLRNNYVESNVGFISSDIKTDIYPSFQKSEELVNHFKKLNIKNNIIKNIKIYFLFFFLIGVDILINQLFSFKFPITYLQILIKKNISSFLNQEIYIINHKHNQGYPQLNFQIDRKLFESER